MRGTVFFFDVTEAGFDCRSSVVGVIDAGSDWVTVDLDAGSMARIPRENVIVIRYDRPRS